MKRVPKYQQIGLAILKEAEQNHFQLDRTQLDLAQEYKVNRLTIRHALNWLEQTGKLKHLLGSQYSPASEILSKEKSGLPKIGFPIWLDNFAELDLPKYESHLRKNRSIHLELLQKGFQLDVQCVGKRTSPNKEKIAYLCKEWKGLILEPMEGDSHLSPNHPFSSMFSKTVVHGMLENRHHNSVFPDFYSGAQLAVRELLGLGCRKILYTGAKNVSISHSFVRLVAIEVATNQHHPKAELIYTEGGHHAEEVFSAVKRFFWEGGTCDAILAGTGYAIAGAMRAVVDLGFKIPQDIQLIGIGRTGFTTYMVPRPTVIATDPYRISKEIARIAVDLARNDSTPKTNIVIPMQLIQGETTKNHLYPPSGESPGTAAKPASPKSSFSSHTS